MKKVIMYLIIISCLVFAVGDYFYSMRDSYNKYVSGEYFFRYKAKTTEAPDPWENWDPNEPMPETDYSDPKEILLLSTNASVYAYGPHDGVCTVLYGDNVIEDFPLSRLNFENETDKMLFNGTKVYTYDEYKEVVNGLTKDQLKSNIVSTKEVANYNRVKEFMFILIGVDVFFGIILFVVKRNELDDKEDLVLLLAALYSIFWEVITAFVF